MAWFGILAIAAGCSTSSDPAEQLRHERLVPPFEEMKGIARPLGAPGPGDWLTSHHERGQSLASFLGAPHLRIAPPLDTIEIIPIGTFTLAQERVIASTADYLGRFYACPVHLRRAVKESDLPDSMFRDRPDLGWRQLSSRDVLRWLADRRDSTAFATIALSAIDLFPDPKWNFVFGQASPSAGSGVWSMFRFGDPAESADAARLCLARTLKTASHEIAHTLPIHHCLAYACLMNGSNHLGELDSRPLDLCPPCLAKLMACTKTDAATRSRQLADFHAAHGLREAEAMNRAVARLFTTPSTQ